MSRIAFITSAKLPALVPDDRLALDLLRARGHDTQPAVWTDPTRRWTDFDLLVLRSCWDYHTRPREFAAWLDGLEAAGVRIENTVSLARWNMEKTYLRDLERAGVATVPTHWIEPGTFRSLAALRAATGWTDLVIKPAISATAWQLQRVAADETTLPAETRRALDERLFLAQPFVPEIAGGEWSLLYFDGTFSHAVIKRPQAGDFRVQNEFGGLATPDVPPVEIMAAASRILAALPSRPLYARVDGVVTGRGFLLLELELLEPALFLATRPGADASFADAIERRL